MKARRSQRLGRSGVGGVNPNCLWGDATASESGSDLAFDLLGRKRLAIEMQDISSSCARSEQFVCSPQPMGGFALDSCETVAFGRSLAGASVSECRRRGEPITGLLEANRGVVGELPRHSECPDTRSVEMVGKHRHNVATRWGLWLSRCDRAVAFGRCRVVWFGSNKIVDSGGAISRRDAVDSVQVATAGWNTDDSSRLVWRWRSG